MPPLVASRQVSELTKQAIKEALFGMRADNRGAEILDRLMIDRFVAAKDDWYDSIRAVLESSGTGMEPNNGF